MAAIINNAKSAISGTIRGVGSVLDLPSNLLRAGVQRTWNTLPCTDSAFVKNFLENRSFVTRVLAKTGAVYAGTAALSAVTGISILSLPVIAVGAIGLRATRITEKTGQGLPSDPKTPLRETAQKISTFKTHQRISAEWDPAIIPNRIAQQARTNATNNINELPSGQPKTSAEWKIHTNLQMQSLIQNASIASTLFFIHSSRLGLEINNSELVKIIQETLAPEGNLWTAYMKHLGKDLGWFQSMRAAIWYFLSYTLGIIPNSIETFMTNVLKEIRLNFEDKTRISHLESGINLLLNQINMFLEVYNSATKAYANDKEPRGDIHFYRQEAIQRLGGTSLEQLCEDFSTTLVNEFFPRIPFFETLKQNIVFGWFFEILDALLGGAINFIGRRIVKWNLPSAVQTLVEKGVDATSPSNLPFTTAITETITELLQDLHDSPSMDTSSPPFKPPKLPEVIEKLLKTLDLTEEKDNPLDTQNKVRKRLKKHEDGSLTWLGLDKVWNKIISNKFQETMLDGGHALIAYTADNTEKILSKVLQLSNKPFELTATVSQEQYKETYIKLEKTANKTFKKVIRAGLGGVPYEQQKGAFRKLYDQEKRLVSASVDEFSDCVMALEQANIQNEPDTLLIHLNHYAEALKNFVNCSFATQASTSTPEVKDAFYDSFHPLYREIPKLADKVLQIQEMEGQRERQALIANQLHKIITALTVLNAHSTNPRIYGAQLEIIKQNLPQNAQEFYSLDASVRQLCADLQAFEWAQKKGVALERHTGALRATIARFIHQAQTASQIYHQGRQHSQLILNQKIQELNEETQRIRSIEQTIQPARVESPFIVSSAANGLIASAATPLVMGVLKRAHQFVTQKDIYDAASRIVMRSVVDTYKK